MSTLAAGSRLGPYQVLALVAAGGMGEVYRAHDSRLGRDVAIKVVRPSLAADPEMIRRFDNEARAAGALNHPNILAVYDVGAEGEMRYVVSELLEGATLRTRMAGVRCRSAAAWNMRNKWQRDLPRLMARASCTAI